MLAPAKIPPSFSNWNNSNGAPYGHHVKGLWWKKRLFPAEVIEKLRGPFAIQSNNETRTFEYPWAFYAADLQPRMSVLEVGGGLAGFQFVLDRYGCGVVNVDPGMFTAGCPCDNTLIEKLNRRFGTRVELRNTTIEKAGLQDEQFDRVFSISVIEHLPESRRRR